jgi:UPF0716 protein FxsA
MFLKLFLAFTLIPAAEIYVLIKIGGFVGALNTVLVIIITGILGAYLTRLQGMHTLYKIKANLHQGIIPTEELIDALIILSAGITLLTPGFLTDIAGLMLLVPRTRFYVKRWLKKKFDRWHNTHDVHFTDLS